MKLFPKILLIAIFIILLPAFILFLIQMVNFEKQADKITVERLLKKKDEVKYYFQNLSDENLAKVKEYIDSDQIEKLKDMYNKVEIKEIGDSVFDFERELLSEGIDIVDYVLEKEKIVYYFKVPIINKENKSIKNVLWVKKVYTSGDYIKYIFSDSYGKYVIHGLKYKGEIYFSNLYDLYGRKNQSPDADWEIIKKVSQSKKIMIKKRDKLNYKYYDSIYFPLKSNNNVIAVFQFSIKRDYTENQIEDNKKNMIYVMAVMLISSLIATLLISRIFLRPISKFEDFTQKVSKGNFNEKLILHTNDEFQTLSEDINVMVKSLRENIKIEAKLKEQLEKEKIKEEYIGKIEKKNLQIRETLKRLKKAQSELIEKEKLASLGLMAGGVAHELNNPLGAILSSIQLIQSDVESDELDINEDLKESFDIIEKATKKSKKIVKDLLIYSKRKDKRNQKIRVLDVVLEAYYMVKHKIENTGIEFIYDKLENEIVTGDFDSLVQVFINLLSNSIDAIEKSPIKKIEVHSARNGNYFEIIVEDSGEGISEEIKDKIFDPFFTQKPVGSGTGLGLSIVMGIIKEHNWKIEVESVKEVGTKFKIKLKKTKEV